MRKAFHFLHWRHDVSRPYHVASGSSSPRDRCGSSSSVQWLCLLHTDCANGCISYCLDHHRHLLLYASTLTIPPTITALAFALFRITSTQLHLVILRAYSLSHVPLIQPRCHRHTRTCASFVVVDFPVREFAYILSTTIDVVTWSTFHQISTFAYAYV